jgi:hypothetical protein
MSHDGMASKRPISDAVEREIIMGADLFMPQNSHRHAPAETPDDARRDRNASYWTHQRDKVPVDDDDDDDDVRSDAAHVAAHPTRLAAVSNNAHVANLDMTQTSFRGVIVPVLVGLAIIVAAVVIYMCANAGGGATMAAVAATAVWNPSSNTREQPNIEQPTEQRLSTIVEEDVRDDA